MTQSTSWSKQT